MSTLRGLLLLGVLYAPLALADPPGPAPEVWVSVEGDPDALEQGEPCAVVVRLEAPAEATGPIVLAPAKGTWVDTVAVELLPQTGTTVLARATPVGAPAGPQATLDGERVAGGLWRFPPEALAKVPPGTCRLRVRLAIPAGTGWTGEASADEILLRVVAPDPARSTPRAAGRARDALRSGRLAEAAALLDAELTRAPGDRELLALRAMLAERGGNPLAARLCLRAATIGAGPSAHPSPELAELEARLAAAALPSAPPAAWTWPPQPVWDRLRELIRASAPADSAVNSASPPPATAPPSATAPPPETAPKPETGPVSPAGPPAASGNQVGPGAVVPAAELVEAKLLADPAGQWASEAKAGSEYGSPDHGAVRLVGPPDVPEGADHPNAWCHHGSAKGREWIEVGFATPVQATEVRVRQNYNPGAIVKVEALEPDGAAHVWWEGVDPARPPGALNAIAWFAVRVPRTEYLVARIRLTLDLDAVVSWQEVDAVQLVGARP